MIGKRVGTVSVPLRCSREREDVMFTKTSRKKSLTDQATELVEQVSPHVEAARERIVNDYLPVAQSVLADARDVAREVAHDAREAAQQAAADAEKSTRKRRRKAARNARVKAGKMAVSAGEAAPVAAPLANMVAEKVEPKPRRRKRKMLLLFGLIGVGTVVFKRLRGQTTSSPSYVPPPPRPRPAPVPDPAAATTPPAPAAEHFEPDPDAPADVVADAVTDAGPGAETVDKGGSFFDEMMADADEHPHKVTTPDQPAETENVSQTKGRRKA
jgi:hypothetical protein